MLQATVDVLCRVITLYRLGLARAMAAAGEPAGPGAGGEPSALAPSSSPSAPTAAAAILSLLAPAHINADDLLGLLCYLAIHAGVQNLVAQIEFVYEYVNAETSLDQGGFYITSLQAACMYAASEDPQRFLTCGHCERPAGDDAAAAAVRCRACGRQFCASCDAAVHAQVHARLCGGACLGGMSPLVTPPPGSASSGAPPGGGSPPSSSRATRTVSSCTRWFSRFTRASEMPSSSIAMSRESSGRKLFTRSAVMPLVLSNSAPTMRR